VAAAPRLSVNCRDETCNRNGQTNVNNAVKLGKITSSHLRDAITTQKTSQSSSTCAATASVATSLADNDGKGSITAFNQQQ
jgi:hypothetical protein